MAQGLPPRFLKPWDLREQTLELEISEAQSSCYSFVYETFQVFPTYYFKNRIKWETTQLQISCSADIKPCCWVHLLVWKHSCYASVCCSKHGKKAISKCQDGEKTDSNLNLIQSQRWKCVFISTDNSHSRVQIFILPHFLYQLPDDASVQDQIMKEQTVTWTWNGNQNINSYQNIS